MLKKTSMNSDSIVVKTQDHVSSDIDGETVLMSIENDKYYGMDSVGSRIWALLETPIKVNKLCETLIVEYEVESSQCEKDTLAYLQELVTEDLVQVVENTNA